MRSKGMANVGDSAKIFLRELVPVVLVATAVIVMVVKYYQAVVDSRNTQVALSMIQAIAATADSLAQSSGSYAAVVNQAAIASHVPNAVGAVINSPWGGTVTIGNGATQTYTVSLSLVPKVICAALSARLLVVTKFTAVTPASGCASSRNTFSYTYDNSK